MKSYRNSKVVIEQEIKSQRKFEEENKEPVVKSERNSEEKIQEQEPIIKSENSTEEEQIPIKVEIEEKTPIN